MNKYALVIGVSDHIATGRQDGHKMLRILRKMDYDIYTIFSRKATREEIYDGFDWLNSMQDEDSQILIFWSAHGSYGSIHGYRCAFPVRILRDEFDEFKSKKQVMMFCGCRCGSLIQYPNPNKPPIYLPTELCTPNRVILTASGYGGLPEPYKQYSKWAWFLTEALETDCSIQEAHKATSEALGGRAGVISDNYGEEFYL